MLCISGRSTRKDVGLPSACGGFNRQLPIQCSTLPAPLKRTYMILLSSKDEDKTVRTKLILIIFSSVGISFKAYLQLFISMKTIIHFWSLDVSRQGSSSSNCYAKGAAESWGVCFNWSHPSLTWSIMQQPGESKELQFYSCRREACQQRPEAPCMCWSWKNRRLI